MADRKKNGRTLFDRPKPTVGCSANGRRRRRRIYKMTVNFSAQRGLVSRAEMRQDISELGGGSPM